VRLVDDPGRLSTQYDRAYRAASFIDRAVTELHNSPHGVIEHDGEQVGRYLATVAALVDPAHADEVDAEFVAEVPRAMVAELGVLSRRDPELSQRLLDTAHALQAGRTLQNEQVALVEQVATMATRDALTRSRQILAT
jgi:hypothetical protein